MSCKSTYTCDRCKKEIIGNGVTASFESQDGLSHLEDGVDLCSDCFLALVNWIGKPEPNKLGHVEQAANSDPNKLGPVERVAKRMNE